jgi:hypothetical protein
MKVGVGRPSSGLKHVLKYASKILLPYIVIGGCVCKAFFFFIRKQNESKPYSGLHIGKECRYLGMGSSLGIGSSVLVIRRGNDDSATCTMRKNYEKRYQKTLL